MRVVPVCLASPDRWPSAGQQTSRECTRTGSLGGLHQVVRVFQMRHERRPPPKLVSRENVSGIRTRTKSQDPHERPEVSTQMHADDIRIIRKSRNCLQIFGYERVRRLAGCSGRFPQLVAAGPEGPRKDMKNRWSGRMAALGAARSGLAMELPRPSNCLTRSVRD